MMSRTSAACLRTSMAGLVLAALLQPALSQTTQAAPARVIVKLRANSVLLKREVSFAISASGAADLTHHRMRDLGQRLGLQVDDGHMIASRMHVALAKGVKAEQLAARLAAEPDVEFAVVDHLRKPAGVMPNDPLFPPGQPSPYPAAGQWYLQPPDNVLVSAVNAPAAWALSKGVTSSGSTIVVAVLDTGVRPDHEDLSAKILPGYNMISDAARAGNSVGRSADASDLGDWLTPTDISQNPSVFDSSCSLQATSSWHGTQVAGIVGASTDNALGMAGLGWSVKILPVRVLGKCGGYDSDIIAGMRWAAGLAVDGALANPNPARVLNLSLGGDGACSQAYSDAVTEINGTGAVIVVAAGNTEGQAVGTPGNCAGVITVAGVRHAGTKVGYSSVGPEVTISAPGGNCVNINAGQPCLYPIVTTSNSGANTPVTNQNGGSIYTNGTTDGTTTEPSLGTSFATPMVSATAALILAVQPALQAAAVKQILANSARPFPTTGGAAGILQCAVQSGTSIQDECYCTRQTCGAGLLDAGNALQAATVLPLALITLTPTAHIAGQIVRISGSTSRPSASASSIVSYQWSLLDGGGIVTLLNPASQQDEVLATPSGVGSFQVQLTVIDDKGHVASTNQTVVVRSAPSTAGTSGGGPASSGSGGGGALEAWELLVLFAAALITAFRRHPRSKASQTARNRPI